MRLPTLEKGHRLREKLLLRVMPLMTGQPVPDVVKTLLYRRDFWGDPYNEGLQKVMRGPSDWKVGERELIASFVSQQIQCVF
jgi:hypothetical protein